MFRTDGDGNIGNQFTDGDPLVPRQPTQVNADWLNSIQEELASTVEAAGIALDKNDQDQVHQAILALARNSSLVQVGTAQHGDVVTFPTPFLDTPAVMVFGGLTNELRSKWGPTGSGAETGAPYASPTNTYEDVAALGVSGTGFTVRARLKQKGSGSTTSKSIGSAGTVADAAGEYSASNVISPAPSVGDSYKVKYSGSVTATNGHSLVQPADGPPYPNSSVGASVTIAIDYSTNGSTWTEVSGARRTFSAGGTGAIGTAHTTTIPTTEITVTAPGMTASGKFRARVVSLTKTTDTSYDGTGTVACSIAFPTSGAVTYDYSTSTTDQYASKTPDAGDKVTWIAIGHA